MANTDEEIKSQVEAQLGRIYAAEALRALFASFNPSSSDVAQKRVFRVFESISDHMYTAHSCQDYIDQWTNQELARFLIKTIQQMVWEGVIDVDCHAMLRSNEKWPESGAAMRWAMRHITNNPLLQIASLNSNVIRESFVRTTKNDQQAEVACLINLMMLENRSRAYSSFLEKFSMYLKDSYNCMNFRSLYDDIVKYVLNTDNKDNDDACFAFVAGGFLEMIREGDDLLEVRGTAEALIFKSLDWWLNHRDSHAYNSVAHVINDLGLLSTSATDFYNEGASDDDSSPDYDQY